MSRVIDERVVSMQFNNSNFEKNVQTSLSTLDKLKQSLKLKDASKGLETISDTVKKFNINPMANAVESVRLKFSALDVMAVTALSNITNSAVNAGKKITKALTIDPIKMGFQEYETQINAVQTILANTESKGTTLDDVNVALDTLNKYADKTIYNFTEMTRNIGTFTAAGIDLDTSVTAIQGIANLAAVSGSTSQQASTAMYQLSQALAAGTVKLMDWNSVVNAGMGGQVFQDALKETARVHGVAIDKMIKDEGSFRETLKNGWITSEILTETLAKFTMTTEGLTDAQIAQNKAMLKSQGYTDEQIEGIFKLGETATNAATKVKTATQLFDTLKEAAQSGWTQTWETIVGDFEEAKELWTNVSEVIGGFINKSAERRNNLLSGALDSNWEKLIKQLNEAGITTEKFENKVRDAAKAHDKDLDKIIEKHGSLEKAVRKGAISSDILKEALSGVSKEAADLSLIDKTLEKGAKGDGVKQMQKALKDLGYDLGKFGEAGDGLDGKFGKVTKAAVEAFQKDHGLEVTGILDEKTLAALEEASTKAIKLKGSIFELIDGIDKLGGRELLIESLKNMFNALVKVIKPIRAAFKDIFPPVTSEQLYNLIEKFHAFTETLKPSMATLRKLHGIFKGVFSIVDVVARVIGGALKTAFNVVKGIIDSINFGSILNFLSTIGNAFTIFRNWLVDGNKIEELFSKIGDKISSLATKIKEFFVNSKAFGMIWEKISKVGKTIRDFFQAIAEGSLSIEDAFTIIKDSIANFFRDFSIKGVFEKIKTFFSNFWTNLKQDILDSTGIDIDAISAKLSEGFSKIFPNISASLKSAFKNLGEFFTNSEAFGMIVDKLSGFGKKIRDFFASIIDGSMSFGDAFTIIKDKIKGFFTDFSLSDVINNIGGFFENFWTKLREDLVASGMDWKTVKEKMITKFKAFVKSISNFFINLDPKAALVGIKEYFVGMWTGIQEWFSGIGIDIDLGPAKEKLSKFAETLKSLIPAIMVIASGIAILVGIKKITEKVSAIAEFIKEFGVSLQGVFDSISKYFDAKAYAVKMDAIGDLIKDVGVTVALIAGSIYIFGKAIELIGSIDPGVLNQGLTVIGGFVVALGIFIGISKFLKGDMNEFGSMMLKLAGALILFGICVKIIGCMDPGTLKQGGIAVAVFLGIMALMMKATTGLGRKKDFKEFGKMMKSLAWSLLLMSAAVAILGNMKTETLLKGGGAVVAFLGIMALMMKATQTLNNKQSISKFGAMMLGLSTSLLLMSAAVAILGNMDTSTLIKGGIAIAIFLGMMTGMMAATKLLAKDMPKFGGMVAAFGTSILLMAGAVAILGNIKTSNLIKGTIAIGALLGMMVGMMAATKLIGTNTKDVAKIGVMMLGFSASLLIISGAIAILGNMNTGKLAKATGAIVALGTMFALLMHTAKSINFKTIASIAVLGLAVWGLAEILKSMASMPADTALGVGIALAALIGSLAAATLMLSKIGNVPITSIGKGLLAFTGVIAIVGAAVAIGINYLPTVADKLSEFMKNLIPFLIGAKLIKPSMVEGVKLLAETILILSAASFITAIGDLVTLGGTTRALNTFLTWIKEVIPVIKEFALELSADGVDINEKNLNAVLSAVKTLAESASLAPKVTAGLVATKWGAGGFYSAAQLGEFAEWIKEVTPVVRDLALDLSYVNGEKININEKAVTSVASAAKTLAEAAAMAPTATVGGAITKFGIAGFYNASQLASFAQWFKDVVPVVKDMAIGLSYINGDKIDIDEDAVTSVATAAKTLAEAASMAPKVTAGGIASLLGIGGFYSAAQLGEFAEWIKDVSSYMKDFSLGISTEDAKTIKNNAEPVGVLVDAIVTLSEGVNNAPDITVGVGLSKWAAGGYVSVPLLKQFTTWIQEAANVIKGFTIGITEDQAKQIRSNAEPVGTLADAVKTLTEGAQNTPSVTVGGGVAKGATILAAGGFVDIPLLGSFITWIQSAAGVMKDFTLNMTEEQAKTIQKNAEPVGALASAVKIIAEGAQNAPSVTIGGGVASGLGVIAAGGFVEVPLLNAFTTWISGAAEAMKSFTLNMTKEQASTLKTNAEAVGPLAEAIKTIAAGAEFAPSTKVGGGVGVGFGVVGVGGYVEVPRIKEFVDWITAAADAAKGLLVDTSNISPEGLQTRAAAVGSLANAIKTIAEGAQYAPTTDKYFIPLVGSYVSTTDLAGFVTFIKDASVALKDFTLDITEEQANTMLSNGPVITTLANVVKTLAEASTNIPKEGSAFEWITGTTDWDSFKTNLPLIGEAVVGFSQKVSGGIDTAAVNTASNVASVIAQTMQVLTSVYSSDPYSLTIGYFEDGSGQLATAIVTFSETVAGINVSAVTSAAGAAHDIASTMQILSGFDYTTIDTASLQTKLSEVSSAISTFANDFLTVDATGSISQITAVTNMLAGLSSVDFSGVSSFQTALVTLSEAGIDAFVLAFESAVSDATTAVENFASSSAAGASSEDVYDGFYSAGGYLGDGLISGINSKKDAVYWAAYALGQKAVQGEKDGQQSNSPSKATIKAGHWLGEGLVIGIKQMGSPVYNTAKSVGESAVNSMSMVIAKISDVFDSDIESQPTIRPVLDLSSVESGASRMAGLFDMSPSIRTMANLSAIDRAMSKNQNGMSNDDIVSAINELGRKLGDISGDTYQIGDVSYDNGSEVSNAVQSLVRAAKMERRR